MSKKDYDLIASVFAGTRPSYTNPKMRQAQDQWTYDVRAMADALERGNPKFDREKFYAACEK